MLLGGGGNYMLDGKVIAITRAPDDAQEFISLVKKSNGTPVALPTIQLVSKGQKIVDEFLESLAQNNPDYSVFYELKGCKTII